MDNLIKRIMDICISLPVTIMLLPVFAVIVMAIKLTSKGPAVFKQERAGKNGKPFVFYKFRTMRTDVDPFGASPKSSQDPRLTKVGKWLREYSLDELPQLLNVLKGDVKYLTKIEQLEHLSRQEQTELRKVADEFAFRSNDYYLSLIDWDDPNDPIRQVIIPNMKELDRWGRLDPSDENLYTVMPGVEHKYSSTVLLLASNVCDGICRYCFRKRVFIEPQKEYLRDLPAALQYIKKHHEITNALLTGGDPLVLTTSKIENIIRQLREIDHIQIIRIGTKIPAFNPYRIIDDPALLEMIEAYSTGRKKIYVMTHFVVRRLQ